MSIVDQKMVKDNLANGTRLLKKATYKPFIKVPMGKNDTVRHTLWVTRNGEVESLPISKRVAEELIAAGFDWS